MAGTTRLFQRLPSDAGVTFEGFEDIKISSREAVRKKLEEFMEYCKGARKPAMRVILGEWGEGKTDAYRRYILPKSKDEGNFAFFVSSSTISNIFSVPRVKELVESTPLPSLRFLVSLFGSIREESKEPRIQNPRDFTDAEDYVESVFKDILGKNKSKRIFVFVDEFEELLLYPVILKQIISGIKETINGQFKFVDENGEYAGCLHIIVAATPDAYYRLQVSDETSLLFGGLGRRAGVINLPLIRKTEGIDFLRALLNYSYNNDPPARLPFDTSGILQGLFRITQGNPGNMVGFFSRVMSSSKTDENRMKIIDYGDFLEFLGKEHIFVYGGSTPCIENETFSRMIKNLEEQKRKDMGKNCRDLIKIMVGEFKPFSPLELSKRLSMTEGEVKNIISIVNNNLNEKENIERSVLKVSKCKEGLTFEDIKTAFKEYLVIEKERQGLRINNYTESIEDLEDRVTHFEFGDSGTPSSIYLPVERTSIESFFEGVGTDTSVELENMIRRKLVSEAEYYLASDELLSRIFPTPIPRELEFVRDRELRMKLWRDTTKNLFELYKRHMPEAFLEILRNSQALKIDKAKGSSPKQIVTVTLDELDISLFFVAINGDVKSTDVEEANSVLRGNRPPIHCCVFLHTGEVTSEAEEKVANKELGRDGENVILYIHLHPTLAKRIVSMYVASSRYEREIEPALLVPISKRILDQEIDFQGRMNEWLSVQETKGIVIRDLSAKSTTNLTELADALKFYINYMDAGATPDEVFERNHKELLMRFVYYDSRIGLIPDVALPKFRALTDDLKSNRFLESVDGKLRLISHPAESRILTILGRQTKLSEKELADYFILKSKKYISEIFLPILEYKGLVLSEGKYLTLSDPKQLLDEVNAEFSEFSKAVQTRSELKEYGYTFIWKAKKEHRFISLIEFYEYMTDNLQQIRDQFYSLSDQHKLQRLTLISRLLKSFKREFMPLFEGASELAEKKLQEGNATYSGFENGLNEVRKNSSRWLKLEFKVDDVEEFRDATRILGKVNESSKLRYDDIKNLVAAFSSDEEKKFYFTEPPERALYFNPKLYKIEESAEKLEEFTKGPARLIEETMSSFEEFDRRHTSIGSRLSTKVIGKDLKVSFAAKENVELLLNDILMCLTPMVFETVSLAQIAKFVAKNRETVLSNIDSLDACISVLDELIAKERSLISKLNEYPDLKRRAEYLLDTEDLKSQVISYVSNMERHQSSYGGIPEALAIKDARQLLESARHIAEALNNLTSSIGEEFAKIEGVWKNCQGQVFKFIEKLSGTVTVVQRKYDIKAEVILRELLELRNHVSVESIRKLALRISDLDSIRKNIQSKFYETVKPILGKKEVDLLEIVIDKTKAEHKSWLPLSELYEAAGSVAIERREISEIIRKLADDGFLDFGVSLVT